MKPRQEDDPDSGPGAPHSTKHHGENAGPCGPANRLEKNSDFRGSERMGATGWEA